MVAYWDQEKIDLAAKLYKDGYTFAECCRELGTGLIALRHYLKQAGVKSRPASRRSRPCPQERLDKCLRLAAQGLSQDKIAKQLDTSQSYICKILRENGVENDYHWKPAQKAELKELYASGQSLSACARHFQTNKATVRRHLQMQGIRIRPHIEATKRGPENGFWRGGRREWGPDGYISIRKPDHPHARNGYVLEHRLVMEQHIGRYLLPGEVVHHIDKNKQNNVIENLQLFASNGEHLAHELKGQVPKWSAAGKVRSRQGHEKWCRQQRKKNRSKAGARK